MTSAGTQPELHASMFGPAHRIDPRRYARCVEVSKRVSWDIDRDVIRGRQFDFSRKFLPDGITKVHELEFLGQCDRLLLSQIQGRTYANMLGLVERFITAKMLDQSRDHWLGDQTALEAMVRFSDEELKHQALFRRLDHLCAMGMPAGYAFVTEADAVARFVLGKSNWAVLALTCHFELSTQAHYLQCVAPDAELSDLYKDVLLFHWKEESQHAVVDELEWLRTDAKLTPSTRNIAIDDLITLIRAIDSVLQVQSRLDAVYFDTHCSRRLNSQEQIRLDAALLAAYRWQYISSGLEHPRFSDLLSTLVSEPQTTRIVTALGSMLT